MALAGAERIFSLMDEMAEVDDGYVSLVSVEIKDGELVETEIPISREYNYSFLLGENGQQLKLKYNNKVSSFKHNVLAQKQDTIGGKYPKIFRNGHEMPFRRHKS